MADINIPGVSDKYKTNDLVNSLIEVEKVPLKAEQRQLDTYKLQKECWQRVNQYMTSVRESARGLFSYNNPFNEKNVASTDEAVASATADRDATAGTYTVQVEQIASADKFLSNTISKNFDVQAGKYTYKVGDKTISFNWKGGTLSDFVTSLNKRGSDVLKASLITVTSDKRVFSIESLKTGKDYALSFEDDAVSLASNLGMIQTAQKSEETALARSSRDISSIAQLSSTDVSLKQGALTIAPQNGVAIAIPDNLKNNPNAYVSLNVTLTPCDDIAEKANAQIDARNALPKEPIIEAQEAVSVNDINLINDGFDFDLPELPEEPKLNKVENFSVVYVRLANGTEKLVGTLEDNANTQTISFKLADYTDIKDIVIKNFNTGKIVKATNIKGTNGYVAKDGTIPLNPISTASDARIKYEGITMTRSSNTIDDVIPHVTLNLTSASTKPIELTVEANAENIKDSIIAFTGQYNRLMAELNILTQNKEAIISEISYFTEEEAESAKERLGIFQSDFTLLSSKQALQSAMAAPYSIPNNETIRLLSQIGISTKTGSGGGINSAQMRGYLEIDEKKLDSALKENLEEIKNLFGFDSDEDKIIDTGVAFAVEKNLASYVQTGGILATKTSSIDTKVKNSEDKIKKLETQIADKESDLKRKYSQMESTLNSLESQSTSIQNAFSNKNN